MTELIAIDFADPDANRLFATSLRETGFGVLKNHPIDQQRVSAIYRHWQSFFNSDDKLNYRYDPENYDGFFPADLAEAAKGHDLRDIKEYFHYYPWGRCPPSLKEELHAYYQDTVDFAKTLLGWIEHHLPVDVRARLSEPLNSMVRDSQQSLLRVLHYPPITSSVTPGAIRAAAHEDINLITILPAANEPGLQVMDKAGEWIDVPCDHGNLIINIGDMLQEATGGFYPSTTHRVINPTGTHTTHSRLSLPLFLHPRPDVALSSRYTARNYLDERLAELRQADN